MMRYRAALWDQVDRAGGFDAAATPQRKIARCGIVSGAHADIATIRDVATRYEVVIDAHSRQRQGRHGLSRRRRTLICIETALR
jgi:hypothetical protein